MVERLDEYFELEYQEQALLKLKQSMLGLSRAASDLLPQHKTELTELVSEIDGMINGVRPPTYILPNKERVLHMIRRLAFLENWYMHL